MSEEEARRAHMEFRVQVQKRGKTKFWVRIPDEAIESLGLKEGDFVKVALKLVERKNVQARVYYSGGVSPPSSN